MKKMLKNTNGITLIALVVTIIVLLILAGISIGMLSGDNSIINQAGNAKTQTDISEEKEIIEQAAVIAMGKSKYGDIDETYFTNELEKNNATVTKSGSKYKVNFSSGRQYEVDQDGNVKEKKVNPNAMEISDLYENGSTYFGWDVINYAETLPTELQDTEWQLFYAGALDGETEERIYLISKEYVKNTLLPSKNGVAPLLVNGSNYKAYFGTSDYSGVSNGDGIIPQYSGSSDIKDLRLQKFNKKYFTFLNTDTSEKGNIKAVAYMMDTDIWKPFATSSKNFAEFAIGGPTIEILFTAYNKYKGTSYETQVSSNTGYQIRKTTNDSFVSNLSGIITLDTDIDDNPYAMNKQNSYSNDAYWIASPGNADNCLMYVYRNNDIDIKYGYQYTGASFRPLVLLDSNYTLEKTKDKEGYDAFKIVEQ